MRDALDTWITILEERVFTHNDNRKIRYYRVVGSVDREILEIFMPGRYIRVCERKDSDALYETYPVKNQRSPKTGFYNRDLISSGRFSHEEISLRLQGL